MITEAKLNGLSVAEATRLRKQASELLERLVADRDQSEKRCAESGKRDPMKFITGRTALENAIASTREMIVNMDNLLVRMQGELDGAEAPASTPRRSRPALRPLVKNGVRPLVGAAADRSSFKTMAVSELPSAGAAVR